MEQLPFKTWPYEEQTKMKHKVFSDYFDKWIKIVGSRSKLNYIDGFGGCGAYKDKNGEIYFGSPILAAEIIKDNKVHLGRDVNLIIIDENKDNIKNIESIFNYKKLDIKPIFVNADFDKTINEILDKVPNIAPTFVFIDPFGFKIKYSTLERIMEIKKSEILMNFMYNGINRFFSLRQNEKIMSDLFGTSEWKSLLNLKGADKENEIINLYRNQLKKISKFVFPYRIEFPKMERTYYYLFHLTNHHKGASIMKSSFAKFNYGRVAYLGCRGNQLTLSEVGDTKIQEIEKFILDKYQNIQKTYLQIIEENIDETSYLESEIRNALKRLEKNNIIYIERFPKIKDYEDWLHPKIVSNALDLLDKEIPKYKKEIEFVHLSFTTDPFMYDYLNKRVYPEVKELTLKIIEKLNQNGIKCTVLTKGIYPRELTNTKKYGAKNEYGITLVSLDENFKKEFEPYSASFEKRLDTLKLLHDKG
jgi:three-Cys-motif partner protein